MATPNEILQQLLKPTDNIMVLGGNKNLPTNSKNILPGQNQDGLYTSESIREGLKQTVLGENNPPIAESITESVNNFFSEKLYNLFGGYGLYKIGLYILVVSVGVFSFMRLLPVEKTIRINKGGK